MWTNPEIWPSQSPLNEFDDFGVCGEGNVSKATVKPRSGGHSHKPRNLAKSVTVE
jgi:hypothetical protein